MAKVVALTINKGGVAKTTSACTLAQVLALTKKKVLLIDLDPQANATRLFGMYDEDVSALNLNYLKMLTEDVKEEEARKFICKSNVKGIDLIPSSVAQLNIERMSERIAFLRYPNGTYDIENKNIIVSLRKNLSKIFDEYDFVLIDSSPSIDQLTDVARATCDAILIPVTNDSFAFEGIEAMINEITSFNESYHELKKIDGIFLTKVKKQTNIFKGNFKGYQDIYQDRFIPVSIRDCTQVLVSNTEFEPLCSNSKGLHSNAFVDYIDLAQSLDYITGREASRLKNELGIAQ